MNALIQGLEYNENHPMRKKAEQAETVFDSSIIVIKGVARWVNTGFVPEPAYLQYWSHIGKEMSLEKSLEEYKRQEKARSNSVNNPYPLLSFNRPVANIHY